MDKVKINYFLGWLNLGCATLDILFFMSGLGNQYLVLFGLCAFGAYASFKNAEELSKKE